MSSSALFERTSQYPGYDLEEMMFEMDEPEFEPRNKPCGTFGINPMFRGIHIRHSKSDSLLLTTSRSFYQFEDLESLQAPQQHRNSVFATFGWHHGNQNLNTNYNRRLHSLEGACDDPNNSDYHSSLEEEDQNSLNTSDATMLTIEGLRSHYNSCFTCGVSWHEDHVSLDCKECGGYAMQRPCPQCDGQCEGVWTRDLAASHKSHKAKWDGDCKMYNNENKILHGLLQNKLSPGTCDDLLAKALDQLKTPL